MIDFRNAALDFFFPIFAQARRRCVHHDQQQVAKISSLLRRQLPCLFGDMSHALVHGANMRLGCLVWQVRRPKPAEIALSLDETQMLLDAR